MSASYFSPFFPAISKISEDQVAEIENEKDRMKERRSKRRKEAGGGKAWKDFLQNADHGYFQCSLERSHQVIISPMAVLWELFPFSLCSQPVRPKAPYGNDSHCSGHRFGPWPHFPEPLQRPAKSFFLWVPAGPYLQSKQQMLQRWANVQVRKTKLIKRRFLMKSWRLLKKGNA